MSFLASLLENLVQDRLNVPVFKGDCDTFYERCLSLREKLMFERPRFQRGLRPPNPFPQSRTL